MSSNESIRHVYYHPEQDDAIYVVEIDGDTLTLILKTPVDRTYTEYDWVSEQALDVLYQIAAKGWVKQEKGGKS